MPKPVGVTEARNDDPVRFILCLHEARVAKIDSNMGEAHVGGVLEKDEITWEQRPHRVDARVVLAEDVAREAPSETVFDEIHEARAVESIRRRASENIGIAYVLERQLRRRRGCPIRGV